MTNRGNGEIFEVMNKHFLILNLKPKITAKVSLQPKRYGLVRVKGEIFIIKTARIGLAVKKKA